MKILEVKNLVKHFDGVYAIDSLSLGIEKGCVTAIIGPNGSGKTTLTNLLSGVLQFDGGFVEISKLKLSCIKPYDVPTYGITRTFQEVRLFEQLTVLDNILVVLTERSVVKSLFERHSEFHLNRAEEVLRLVNLWEKRNELALNLSYGQRKLLEVSRVLCMNAEIFLFDEPFAGLFPEMVKIVVKVIEALREQEKTIVLIEHNMDIIRKLADNVIVLDSGKLLAEGKPEKVLSRRDVIEAYLGE